MSSKYMYCSKIQVIVISNARLSLPATKEKNSLPTNPEDYVLYNIRTKNQ